MCDVAKQNNIVVALNLLESAGEKSAGIGIITAEELFISASNPRGGVCQPFTCRVVSGPFEQRAHGSFGICSVYLALFKAWNLDRRNKKRVIIERGHVALP